MKKKILILVFIIYILVLFKITVFRNTFGLFNLFSNGKLYLEPAVNLIDAYKYCTIKTFIYLFIGNIVWFIPFGFLLPAITKLSNLKIIAFAALTSFLIEFMQYVFGTGISEIDDFILNVFGALIGLIICRLVIRIKHKIKQKNNACQ